MTRRAWILAIWLLGSLASPASAMTLAEELPWKTDRTTPAALASAIESFRKGDGTKALDMSRAFVKEHADVALGFEVLGATALDQGHLDEASEALEAALRLDPNRPLAQALLGEVALTQRDAAKAHRAFANALSLMPELVLARRGYAQAALRLGHVQEAISEALESTRRSGGRDADSLLVLAGSFHEVGRHDVAEAVLERVLELAPGSQQAQLMQGIVKLDLQKFDEAAALFDAVAQRDPASPWARLGLAVVERFRGQIPQSRAKLEQLVGEHPKWSQAQFQLAETRLAQDDVQAAMDAFDAAAHASADPTLTWLHAGEALLKYGRVASAMDVAKRLLGRDEVPARALLASAYLAQGRADLAAQELGTAFVADPTNPATALRLGRLYLDQHRAEEALAQFDIAALLASNDPDVMAAQAEAYAALGRAQEAMVAAKAFATARQETPATMLFVGSINETLGRLPQAEAAYRQALTKDPKSAAAMRALALLYARTKRTDEAIRTLTRLAGAFPTAVTPLVDLALLHEQAGRVPEAIETYREALARNGYHPVALNNLAVLLGRDPQHLAEAAELAERAYRVAPADTQIADTLGWIRYTRGDPAAALPLVTRAAVAHPDDPQVHYHLGMVSLAHGDKARARTELERALQAPAFPDAEQAKRALRAL